MVDTACNKSVLSTGWLERARRVWLRHGFQSAQVSKREGPYGGLSGDHTTRTVGKVKVGWPMVVVTEPEFLGEVVDPIAMSVEVNQIEGNTSFLMGLDLQRQLMLKLDVIENECRQRLPSGEWRKVELAQASRTGLLCIHIDDFERHDRAARRLGQPTTAQVFAEYESSISTAEHDETVTRTDSEIEGRACTGGQKYSSTIAQESTH